MAFKLKSFLRRALKPPASLRKINVGKTVKRAISSAIEGFEGQITQAGAAVGRAGGVGQVAEDVTAGARFARNLPMILGGAVIVVGLFLYMRKRGR